MVLNMCALQLACNGQELNLWNTPLFACPAFSCDIRDYLTQEVPPHWHHALELMVLQEGAARVSFPGGRFTIQAGEAYFVNADVLHEVSCGADGPCRYHTLVFDPSVVAGTPGSVFDTLYVRPLLENGPPALALRPGEGWDGLLRSFDAAYAACAAEPEGYEFQVRSALSQILLELKRRSVGRQPVVRPAAQQELRMKQMLTWIDRHYGEAVTVAEVAASAGICPRECQRAFSRLLGLSPVAYLQRRRAAAAAELLAGTDLPVTEIGLRCGFGSPSYFAKQFSRVIGCSPHLYRANIRDGAAPPL